MITDAYIRKEFVSGTLRHQVLETTTSWNQYHRIVRLTPSPVSDIVAPHQREARITDHGHSIRVTVPRQLRFRDQKYLKFNPKSKKKYGKKKRHPPWHPRRRNQRPRR